MFRWLKRSCREIIIENSFWILRLIIKQKNAWKCLMKMSRYFEAFFFSIIKRIILKLFPIIIPLEPRFDHRNILNPLMNSRTAHQYLESIREEVTLTEPHPASESDHHRKPGFIGVALGGLTRTSVRRCEHVRAEIRAEWMWRNNGGSLHRSSSALTSCVATRPNVQLR